MSAQAAVYEERVWLKRAVLVLVRPREVFVRLRDDSDDAARARSEALLALVWLAGISGVLWTPVGGRVLNDVNLDWIDLMVWAFIGGGLYGFAIYFGGGLILYWLTRAVGGITYRQVRHVLGFAGAPIALSLFVVWPARVAVYGEDVFRSGRSDRGAGNDAFVALELAFVAWALALLVLGLRLARSNASSSPAGIS
jgi:Yip1 domain